MGHNNDYKKRLDEIPIANINNEELAEIKILESKLNDKYYVIAFEKDGIN